MVSRTVRRFGKVEDAVDIPDLVAIQRESYDSFLQLDVAATRRKCTGLEALFQEIFPIPYLFPNVFIDLLMCGFICS